MYEAEKLLAVVILRTYYSQSQVRCATVEIVGTADAAENTKGRVRAETSRQLVAKRKTEKMSMGDSNNRAEKMHVDASGKQTLGDADEKAGTSNTGDSGNQAAVDDGTEEVETHDGKGG